MWNFLKYWIWKQWNSNQDTKCCHCKVVFLSCPTFGLLHSAQIQIFSPMKEAVVTTPYSAHQSKEISLDKINVETGIHLYVIGATKRNFDGLCFIGLGIYNVGHYKYIVKQSNDWHKSPSNKNLIFVLAIYYFWKNLDTLEVYFVVIINCVVYSMYLIGDCRQMFHSQISLPFICS